MKKLLLLTLAAAALAMTGCKDDDGPVEEPTYDVSITNVQLLTGSSYKATSIEAQTDSYYTTIATSQFSRTKMVMELPASLPADEMATMEEYIDYYWSEEVKADKQGVLWSGPVHFIGYRDGAECAQLLNVYAYANSTTAYNTFVYHAYVSDDVNVAGNFTITVTEEDATLAEISYEVKLNLKKGWNRFSEKISGRLSEDYANKVVVSNNIPGTLFWAYRTVSPQTRSSHREIPTVLGYEDIFMAE